MRTLSWNMPMTWVFMACWTGMSRGMAKGKHLSETTLGASRPRQKCHGKGQPFSQQTTPVTPALLSWFLRCCFPSFHFKLMLFSFTACFEMDTSVIVLLTECVRGGNHYFKEPGSCKRITMEGCHLRTVFQRQRIVLKEYFYEKSERICSQIKR